MALKEVKGLGLLVGKAFRIRTVFLPFGRMEGAECPVWQNGPSSRLEWVYPLIRTSEVNSSRRDRNRTRVANFVTSVSLSHALKTPEQPSGGQLHDESVPVNCASEPTPLKTNESRPSSGLKTRGTKCYPHTEGGESSNVSTSGTPDYELKSVSVQSKSTQPNLTQTCSTHPSKVSPDQLRHEDSVVPERDSMGGAAPDISSQNGIQRGTQDYWSLLTNGTPVRVGVCGGAGRGVFTTLHVSAGEVIHWAMPVVAHPALECLDKVCYNCLCHLATSGSSALPEARPPKRIRTDPTPAGEPGHHSPGLLPEDKCGNGEQWELSRETSRSRQQNLDRNEGSHTHPPSEVEDGSGGDGGKGCKKEDGGGGALEDAGEDRAGGGEGEEEGWRGRGSVRFCSRECQEMATEQFYRVEVGADWGPLLYHCRDLGVKFALVVRRLACLVITGAASANVLRPLCYVQLTGPLPDQWVQEHGLLRGALEASGVPASDLEFLTADWYAGVTARLHLNAFKVAMAAPLPGTSLLEAAAAAVEGDGAVGTAIYLLASLYNHDCDPNVEIWWPSDAAAQLRARRDIHAGEELRITYLDASMGLEARQAFLREAYGFLCNCPRCVDETC